MGAYSELLSDWRDGWRRPAKSRTPWPPARSGRLQKVLFCGALAIASCAATVGALTQENTQAPRTLAVAPTPRVALDAARATAAPPVAAANPDSETHETAACGDFKVSFLSQQCSKFHASRPVRPHRVATWILGHPAASTPSPLARTPNAPPSELRKTTNNLAERHVRKTAASTEPSAWPPRRRADIALPDRYE
jgi:hypothetical protein